MKITILTEASNKKGYGHIKRCEAIAQQLQKHNCQIQIWTLDDEVKEHQSINWIEYHDQIISEDDIIILDSYTYGQSWFDNLVANYKKVVVIDDNERINFHDCMLINPNVHGPLLAYEDIKLEDKFLGLEYSLVKKITTQEIDENYVLITFGGTDPKQLTIKALHELAMLKMHKKVIIGSGFIDEYKNEIIHFSKLNNIKFILEPTHESTMQLIKDAKYIVSACGQTLNEIIVYNKQAIVFPVVDNQLKAFEYVIEKEMATTCELKTIVKHIETYNFNKLKQKCKINFIDKTIQQLIKRFE